MLRTLDEDLEEVLWSKLPYSLLVKAMQSYIVQAARPNETYLEVQSKVPNAQQSLAYTTAMQHWATLDQMKDFGSRVGEVESLVEAPMRSGDTYGEASASFPQIRPCWRMPEQHPQPQPQRLLQPRGVSRDHAVAPTPAYWSGCMWPPSLPAPPRETQRVVAAAAAGYATSSPRNLHPPGQVASPPPHDRSFQFRLQQQQSWCGAVSRTPPDWERSRHHRVPVTSRGSWSRSSSGESGNRHRGAARGVIRSVSCDPVGRPSIGTLRQQQQQQMTQRRFSAPMSSPRGRLSGPRVQVATAYSHTLPVGGGGSGGLTYPLVAPMNSQGSRPAALVETPDRHTKRRPSCHLSGGSPARSSGCFQSGHVITELSTSAESGPGRHNAFESSPKKTLAYSPERRSFDSPAPPQQQPEQQPLDDSGIVTVAAAMAAVDDAPSPQLMTQEPPRRAVKPKGQVRPRRSTGGSSHPSFAAPQQEEENAVLSVAASAASAVVLARLDKAKVCLYDWAAESLDQDLACRICATRTLSELDRLELPFPRQFDVSWCEGATCQDQARSRRQAAIAAVATAPAVTEEEEQELAARRAAFEELKLRWDLDAKPDHLGTWMIWMVHRVELNDPSLEKLDFGCFKMPAGDLEERIAPKLMRALAVNTHLKHLLLGSSGLRSAQAGDLAQALKVNKCLQKVHLQGNFLELPDLKAIFDAVAQSQVEELMLNDQRSLRASSDQLQEGVEGENGDSMDVQLDYFKSATKALESNKSLLKVELHWPKQLMKVHYYWRDKVLRAMLDNKELRRQANRKKK